MIQYGCYKPKPIEKISYIIHTYITTTRTKENLEIINKMNLQFRPKNL